MRHIKLMRKILQIKNGKSSHRQSTDQLEKNLAKQVILKDLIILLDKESQGL